SSGFWGFVVFMLSSGAALFWFTLGLVLRKLGRLKETLLPSTPEASLRRRLLLSSLKRSVRGEADTGIDLLTRLEHVRESLERELGERLSPGELTYRRYHDTFTRSWRWALNNLGETTALIESLAVLEASRRGDYLGESRDVDALKREKRAHIAEGLRETDQLVGRLERLALALARDMQTRPGEEPDELRDLLDDLGRLADRARLYARTARAHELPES
ncbi:MAG: hypothetical protein R3286_13720, partial [Gammaproteobacteria bacterium]|nr:hypothetical protein [Gammaproteobacteria bacterium]